MILILSLISASTAGTNSQLILTRRPPERRDGTMIKKTPKGWIVLSYEGKKLGIFLTFSEAKSCLESYESGL
jgi:hypothetical protein